MRKIVFTVLCFLTLVIITGCDNENEMEAKDSNLSLIAPNGEMIAQDMASLEEETAVIVAKQFGDDLKFDITNIEYTSDDDGYLALICYKLKNGESSNYAKSSSAKTLTSASTDVLHYETTENAQWEITEDEIIVHNKKISTRGIDSTEDTKFVCKSAKNCKPCQVKIQTQSSLIDGSVTVVSCSEKCVDCKLEVTIYN